MFFLIIKHREEVQFTKHVEVDTKIRKFDNGVTLL